MPLLRALATCVAAALLLAAPAAAPAAPAGTPVTVAGGPNTPWEVLPLPDGRTLVTERVGRIRTIDASGALRSEVAYSDPAAGDKKFLGLEPHPAYVTNRLLYLYVTYKGVGSRVVRLRDDAGVLRLDRVIFDGPIRTDFNHDGGRMRFGPDGKLYVTTGDVHDPDLPQDPGSLNGKILRLNDDGSAPADNPFVARGGDAVYVWSTGHRHPQGLSFDAQGRLWETEHGPSNETYDPVKYPGGNSRFSRDELNLIVKGGNYGWPVISGSDTREGMIAPVRFSGTTEESTWAPGGLTFADDGSLYAPMLRGTHLRRFAFAANGDGPDAGTELYRGTYGRLRTAAYDPCRGALWFTTDGASADVKRVAIDREGRPGRACGALTPVLPRAGGTPPSDPPPPSPGPGATTPGPDTPGPGTTPPPGTPGPGTGDPAPVAPGLAGTPAPTAAQRLLGRAEERLRRDGLRGLLRRGGLSARAGGFGPGTLSLRVRRTAGRRLVTVAVGTTRVRGRAPVTARARLTGPGRRALRRARRIRLVVTVAFRPAGGRVEVRRGELSVPR